MSFRHPALALVATTALALVLALTAIGLPGQASQPLDPRLALPPLQAPGEWFDSQRSITTDGSDYAGAIAAARSTRAATLATAPEWAGLTWDLLGPTNIGGRVVDLALVPGQASELFVATASGGVWHSDDFGTTFSPRWPTDITQAMGALAAGSDGVLYAGTGEANPGGGSIVYGGTGMYRSSDLGATWQHVGLDTAGAFGRIAVDPTDPSVVYAAAAGNLFVPGGERGLYGSRDGGDTWQLLLAGDNDTTGAVDVTIDPSNPDRILVAMWDHFRDPEHRVYAGPGSGLHLSEDGGDTWRQIGEITLDDPAEVGRIGVAFAPSDPSRAYAVIANTLDGRHGEWFVSDDGGRSFDGQPSSGLAGNHSSFGWWFGRIFVDPADADHLYVAGVELIESLDGGRTFLAQSNTLAGVVTGINQGNVHADQHAMVWSDDIPGLVYLGNDGGVYRSNLGGVVGSWIGGLSQGWTQHYSVDVDEQTAEYIVSGLQDNLCQMHVGGSGGISAAAWVKYGLCGDGLTTRIDPGDPLTTYYCSQYGGCGRAIAGAPDLRFRMPGDRYGWLADIQFQPGDPSVLFTAGAQLWRSSNRGDSWTAYSGDLSSDPEQTDPNPGYRLRGVATTIAVHPDGKTVWVGTDEGRLWVNRDIGAAAGDTGNATWTLIGGDGPSGVLDDEAVAELGLPARTWITSIAVDPEDADVAYVAFSGFRQGDDAARLFRTDDGGASFQPIGGTTGEGGLPRAPINDVILAGRTLVVASDVGVHASTDGGATWLTVGDLPTVPVLDLRYHAATQTLTAATFGHGVRRTSLPGADGPGTTLLPLPDLPVAAVVFGG